MSTVKKASANTIREELRVLNAEANEAANSASLLNWLTPDFWTMVSAAATNVIAVLALVGWIQASQVQGVTQAVAALIGATQVIIVNSALVWKYLSGRAETRAQMINAQYQYMSMVACEKLRANNG